MRKRRKWTKWTKIWLRIGLLAFALLAVGLALMAVAANSSLDAEPSLPVQGDQTQNPGAGGDSQEIPNPEEEANRQESSNLQEGSDRQTVLQVPEEQNLSTKKAKTTTAASKSNTHQDSPGQADELTLADFPSPVQGPILRAVGSYYSEDIQDYLYHSGTDYLQAEGAIITATRGGTVIFAGPDPFLGQKVEIDCSGGWFVTYGCLDNLRVKAGDKVERQAVLGQVALDGGPDAVSGQTQLHYEVRHGEEVIE